MNGTGNNGVSAQMELGRIAPAVLELLLAKAPAILWTTDRELRFTLTLGDGLLAMGVRPDQATGRTLYEYLGNRDDSLPPVAAHLAALRGEARDYEYEWKGRLFDARTEPLREQGGGLHRRGGGGGRRDRPARGRPDGQGARAGAARVAANSSRWLA